MCLIEIQMRAAMLIVIVSQVNDGVVIEKQLVQRGIYPRVAIRSTPLQHHSGLADASGTLNHNETVVPCYVIVELAMQGRIKALGQAS